MTTALPMQFTVGLVQMSMSDDPEANLRKAVARIREAAEQGATLVCLPELFRTRYIGQREDHALFDLAEAVPGPTTETLGKIAKENGVVGGEQPPLSHGDRLASVREGEVRRATAGRLEDDPTQPRDRQRLLGRRGESRRRRAVGR